MKKIQNKNTYTIIYSILIIIVTVIVSAILANLLILITKGLLLSFSATQETLSIVSQITSGTLNYISLISIIPSIWISEWIMKRISSGVTIKTSNVFWLTILIVFLLLTIISMIQDTFNSYVLLSNLELLMVMSPVLFVSLMTFNSKMHK